LGWGADGPDRTAVGLEGVAWPVVGWGG